MARPPPTNKASVLSPCECVTGVSAAFGESEDGSWVVITASSFDKLAEVWNKSASIRLQGGLVQMMSVFPNHAVQFLKPQPAALPVVKRREVTKRRTLLKE